jgi:hypothetical protein
MGKWYMHSRVHVFAYADQTLGVLEEHVLERDHHTLKVGRALLDVIADLMNKG